jgi:uncharacterized protein (DUF1800 family)
MISLVSAVGAGGSAFAASGAAASLSYAGAARFLEQATWGPTSSDIATLRKIGYKAWFAQQETAPQSTFLNVKPGKPGTAAVVTSARSLFCNGVSGPDQLRQRMAFALGQIWVTSDMVLPYDEPSGSRFL